MIRTNNSVTECDSESLNAQLAEELFKTDGYLVINKTAIQILGITTAVILGEYIDRSKYFASHHPEANGWFFITYDEICRKLQVGEFTIRRCKQDLIKEGILLSQMRGAPPKEYLKINMLGLYRMLKSARNVKDAETTSLKTRKPKGCITTKVVIYNKHIVRDKISGQFNNDSLETPSNKKPTLKERNVLFFPLAKYLAKIIQSKKDIKFTHQQISKWANELRQLSENNQVSIPRIRGVLTWYEKHIGGEFIPVVESGHSFREKFSRLEDAIHREEHPYGKGGIVNALPTIVEFGETWTQASDGEYYNDEGRMLRR